jgi:hypothetical protein
VLAMMARVTGRRRGAGMAARRRGPGRAAVAIMF